uniref:Peptidase M12B domain-containing protein n=1 Tax=Macrostomum lignano TaxID=282301 RepID=A0A1I8H231_9PLAT
RFLDFDCRLFNSSRLRNASDCALPAGPRGGSGFRHGDSNKQQRAAPISYGDGSTAAQFEQESSDSANKTQDFENVPVTVTENGLSMTFSARQIHHPSHAHYRDIESKSVISVRHVNGKRRISGHVMHEGTSYFLEPLGDADHQVTMNALNPHDLAKKVNVARDIESRKKRQTNTASTNYKVEIYLLIDSRVWSAFKSIYSTDSAALTELHFYYTHILNGIDTSYRNIGSPSISVSCIGMTISKTLADDKWMAGEDTEGSNILSAMKNYIVGKTADHFMAFTRMDITGGGSSSVCGMAYVGGVCRNIRVSINEDQGLQSWGTAAHELAHNLGSHHDASGNTCSSGAKNLMSPSGGMYNLANVANSYRFSSCSVSYMSAYLNSLGSTNCMTSDQGSRLSELTSNTREGTRLTLDQVCRFFQPNGPGKFYLTTDTFNNPASICAMIYCASSDRRWYICERTSRSSWYAVRQQKELQLERRVLSGRIRSSS